MRHFFYLKCLQDFTVFVLTKVHPGKQFEPIWNLLFENQVGGEKEMPTNRIDNRVFQFNEVKT